MYFDTKNYLKSIHNYTAKHALHCFLLKRKQTSLYVPSLLKTKQGMDLA